MGLKHSLAALVVAAAPMSHAQEGGPPGSGIPGEMGGEVETIIVIGSMFRCPDGTMVGDITACPAYVSLPNSYFFSTWDPISRMIREFHQSAQTCGATVDASCECGSGKVKVYDEAANTFHCYDEPPPNGCPKWDQTFDFDLSVWSCVTRPFDDDPADAAQRLKDCMKPGVVTKHWGRLETLLEYDNSLAGAGQAKCSMVNGSPVPSAVKINADGIASQARRLGHSPWQWLAEP